MAVDPTQLTQGEVLALIGQKDVDIASRDKIIAYLNAQWQSPEAVAVRAKELADAAAKKPELKEVAK